MPDSDKLERLLEELTHEVGRRGPTEEERERLAEWFGGVLDHEHRKGERTASLTEMLRQGHGLGESSADDDSDDPSPGSAA